MKKSLLLASIVALGCSGLAYSAHVSPEQALHRVNSSSNARKVAGKFKETPKFHSTVGDLYVFTTSGGYMVLPNNDEAPAMLAYSENAGFSAKGNPGLEYWLDFYNRELSYLNSQKGLKKVSAKANARPTRKPIAPLTETRWNQSAPYNDMCPLDNGARSVTGCVATAMAQVMKYHNYPEKGKGSHSYTWETGNETLSFDYANTTFDWANMTNTYGDSSTEEQKKAVATLMYACGVSVDMGYTSNESSASTITMGQSFLEYFDYDKGLWMPMRDYYGLYDWEDMIYADLEKGLPVLYAGQGTAGGHQFICDGYSEDGYFHFNWGWGGMSDGYFLLTALNPASLGIGGGAGGFNSGQQIALGVQPPKADSKPVYLMYCTGNLTSQQQNVSAGSPLTLTVVEENDGFFNLSMTEIPAGGMVGAHIKSNDGSYDQYISGPVFSEAMPVFSGYSGYSFRFPTLSDGEYTITPAYNAGSGWENMRAPVGKVGSLIASVNGGNATITTPQEASVTVTEVNAPSTIYIGQKFPLKFSVVNSTSEEYIGEVIPILIDANENEASQSEYCPIDVLPETTDNITDYIGTFHSYQNNPLTPGTYFILFVNESGNPISEPVEVTIAEAPANTSIAISDFTLDSPNPVTDPSAVKFSFTANCEEGYFANTLTVAIFNQGGGRSVGAGNSNILYLIGGESANATATVNLSSLEPGTYMAAVFNGQQQMTINNSIEFEIADIATGINGITNSEEGAKVIYNLQGQRCQEPLQPGLYIINGRKVMVK
ncbi:MAG: C10 family peptidase [Muribaculaceae bacterium]|nr:C10 family peptidase [Muribaculaceae bacterium]